MMATGVNAGLPTAIEGILPAPWQRCRTHDAANLLSLTPKASWPWV
jgi:putative transposase